MQPTPICAGRAPSIGDNDQLRCESHRAGLLGTGVRFRSKSDSGGLLLPEKSQLHSKYLYTQ